jgi:hypothetical protein
MASNSKRRSRAPPPAPPAIMPTFEPPDEEEESTRTPRAGGTSGVIIDVVVMNDGTTLLAKGGEELAWEPPLAPKALCMPPLLGNNVRVKLRGELETALLPLPVLITETPVYACVGERDGKEVLIDEAPRDEVTLTLTVPLTVTELLVEGVLVCEGVMLGLAPVLKELVGVTE